MSGGTPAQRKDPTVLRIAEEVQPVGCTGAGRALAREPEGLPALWARSLGTPPASQRQGGDFRIRRQIPRSWPDPSPALMERLPPDRIRPPCEKCLVVLLAGFWMEFPRRGDMAQTCWRIGGCNRRGKHGRSAPPTWTQMGLSFARKDHTRFGRRMARRPIRARGAAAFSL